MQLKRYFNALRKTPRTPPYLLFFVTARCDAHCRHCFFWRTTAEPPPELTLDEIGRVASHIDGLLQLTLTGGDAFLRDDLPEIAELFATRSHALNMTLATNGYPREKVLASMERVLAKVPTTSNVTVDLSLDGLGADHDFIRNCPGIFDRFVATVRGLRQLQSRGRPFHICVNTVLSRYNQDRLRPVYDFLLHDLNVDIINILYLRGEPRDPAAKGADLERYREYCGWIREDTAAGHIRGYSFFTDTLHAKDFILRDIIANTVRTNRFQYPCTAGRLTGVIYPQGNVAPCELIDVTLGNLRDVDYDLARIWTSARTDAFRKKAAYERCFCTHQCFLSNNILFNPALLPRLVTETARLKLRRLVAPRRARRHVASS